MLLRMASYFHDDVREQAYEALSFLVGATTRAFPPPSPGLSPLQPDVSAALDARIITGACQLYKAHCISHLTPYAISSSTPV